jgi:hypothetical protein
LLSLGCRAPPTFLALLGSGFLPLVSFITTERRWLRPPPLPPAVVRCCMPAPPPPPPPVLLLLLPGVVWLGSGPGSPLASPHMIASMRALRRLRPRWNLRRFSTDCSRGSELSCEVPAIQGCVSSSCCLIGRKSRRERGKEGKAGGVRGGGGRHPGRWRERSHLPGRSVASRGRR